MSRGAKRGTATPQLVAEGATRAAASARQRAAAAAAAAAKGMVAAAAPKAAKRKGRCAQQRHASSTQAAQSNVEQCPERKLFIDRSGWEGINMGIL